jgi:hypothetical protein
VLRDQFTQIAGRLAQIDWSTTATTKSHVAFNTASATKSTTVSLLGTMELAKINEKKKKRKRKKRKGKKERKNKNTVVIEIIITILDEEKEREKQRQRMKE